MNLRSFGSTIADAWTGFGAKRGWDVAGVISFFLTMTIVGLTVLASYAAGLAHDGKSIIANYMDTVVGPHASGIFIDLLERANLDWRTLVAVSLVGLVVVSSSIYLLVRTHRVVNTIVAAGSEHSNGSLAVWLRRVGSSVLVVTTGVLLTVSFTFKAALELFDYFGISPVSDYIWWFRAIEVVLALGLATVLFAGLFKAMLDTRLPRHCLWQGAFFGAKLYTAVQIVAAFAVVYLGGMSYYGEAAIILVLLGYIYFSAASFLLGVEFAAARIARSDAKVQPHARARDRNELDVSEASPAMTQTG